MGLTHSHQHDKRVVVIGGGYAGAAAARALDSNFNVTLVARQQRLVHDAAGVRAGVVPGWETRVAIPLDGLLSRGKLLGGVEATKVDDNAKTVTLSTGEELKYDYLIIAAGTLGPKTVGAAVTPTAADGIDAVFKARQAAIASAKRILVIGGGATSIEQAAEIVAHYGKAKEVVLVTAEGLMEDPFIAFSDSLKATLYKMLEAQGVTLHLNAGFITLDREADENGFIVGTSTYRLSGDGKLSGEFDLAIPCLGTRKTPPFIAASGWLDKLDGVFIKVDTTLQVEGCPAGTVFAIGDIASLKESKLAYFALQQAKLVARNIEALATGQALEKYHVHTKPTLLLPLGPHHGAGQFNGWLMGDFASTAYKSKSLFVPKMWHLFGSKAELEQIAAANYC
eukprot:TRINITY_DN3547_c0_g1_i3.p1 TRINITY_DN3547_c0_g1~~TRINITY_DN3547_c0_g1_i3.p1  ORF type:complete len:395 (-),score=144.26 TRINITY_DN3547_c0_g1_i3:687-1871(-)